MWVRFASYLLPSLMVHCAFFAALAATPREGEAPAEVYAVEFTTITDEGGGRLGDDEQIGDATEIEAPPERIFRRVAPPKPKHAERAPTETPKPESFEPSDESAPREEAADAGENETGSAAASHSLAMGSAGRDPRSTTAGSGSGGEGIDRRSALRAWLREIQREVNKIATRNYPSSAVRMRLEGKLRLGITIGADGRILGVRILSSSGHSVLDDSATDSVMALHIPAPPDELGWKEREISLPIRYALQ